MPGDELWNTFVSVAIMIVAGLFVTMTSLAALNAASLSAHASTCSHQSCVSVASNY